MSENTGPQLLQRARAAGNIAAFPFYIVFVAFPYALYWAYREARYGEKSPITKAVEEVQNDE